MSESPPADPFELLKKLWAPTGLPVPGMIVPTLDPAEIDKRIDDLKRVENWMTINLNVLRMTIQSLEMQKATLAAMAAAMPVQPEAKPGAGKTEGKPEASAQSAPNLADAWWQLFQQMTATAAGTPDKTKAASGADAEPHSDPKAGAPKGKRGG